MGYRSDVAYTIRFVSDHDERNKQSFYTFLAEAKAKAATALCFGGRDRNNFEVDERNFRINFSALDVKWYESYPDVQCHEALIALANEWVEDTDNNAEVGYMFVRIGEENDDTEEKCGGEYDWDWLRVSRTIVADWL